MKKQKTMLGYIIRLANDKTGSSMFYSKRCIFSNLLKDSMLFSDSELAVKEISELKKKSFVDGFMYISKAFCIQLPSKKVVAVKLTKPDKYDFLNAI